MHLARELGDNGGNKAESHAGSHGIAYQRHATVAKITGHEKATQLPMNLYGAPQSQVCPAGPKYT